jgi:hypothetical protein
LIGDRRPRDRESSAFDRSWAVALIVRAFVCLALERREPARALFDALGH